MNYKSQLVGVFLLSAVAIAITFNECKPDTSLLSDVSAKLNFTTDTLRFDTVFTQIVKWRTLTTNRLE